jgi:ribosomal protein RSM22 (predicted rRNA methylase)
LRALALDLGRESTRLHEMNYQRGEALTTLATAQAADFIVASYMIGEIADTKQAELAELLWDRTNDTLLVVEPGTPAGYARIIALRARLVALGAHVAAPCPHDGKCPLQAPDWCHFTQRLPRLRAHKQLKGADLPFEDEKFSYVALTRSPPLQRPARVLAQPVVNKAAISVKICSASGISNAVAPRRDKTSYQRLKKISWGDAVFDEGGGVE